MPERQPMGLGLHIKTKEGENTFLFLTPLSCRLKVTALNPIPSLWCHCYFSSICYPDSAGSKRLTGLLPSRSPQPEEESLTNATAPPLFPTASREMRALISDLYITGSGYLLDLQACQHGLVDPAKRKARASVSARAEGSPVAPAGERSLGRSRPPDGWRSRDSCSRGSSPPGPEGRAVSSGRAGATQNPMRGVQLFSPF